MAKKQSITEGIDARHWVLVAIIAAFAATNAVWYEAFKTQDQINTERLEDISLLQQQINEQQ